MKHRDRIMGNMGSIMTKDELIQRLNDVGEFLGDETVQLRGLEYETAMQEFDDLWEELAKMENAL